MGAGIAAPGVVAPPCGDSVKQAGPENPGGLGHVDEDSLAVLGDAGAGLEHRLLHALQGLGKTAALYMYPYEDHGQVSRETLLDNWARWAAWLDKYVKNPAPPKTEEKKSGGN